MKAQRLLAILILLQQKKQITARELAEQLEVSIRTIFRDIDSISSLGIPVYALRGQSGGFKLDKEVDFHLVPLSLQEISDLFINKMPGPLTDLGFGTDLEQALEKLQFSLPLHYRQHADQIHKRIHLDPVQWHKPYESTPHLKKIEEAMWENRKVFITYQEEGSNQLVAEGVALYGLVAKTSIWYLVGEGSGGIKVWRVSHIKSIEYTSESFICPKEFDLVGFWRAWCSKVEVDKFTFESVILLSSEFFKNKIQYTNNGVFYLFTILEEQDEWVKVNMKFEDVDQALLFAIQNLSYSKVLSPANLVNRLLETAESITLQYKNNENAVKEKRG